MAEQKKNFSVENGIDIANVTVISGSNVSSDSISSGNFTASIGFESDAISFFSGAVRNAYLNASGALSPASIDFRLLPKPSQALTASLANVGPGLFKSGSYVFLTSFLSPTGETQVNSASLISDVVVVSDSASNGQILLTGIPTASAYLGVTGRNIYVNLSNRIASGSTKGTLVATINDNVTTTATINYNTSASFRWTGPAPLLGSTSSLPSATRSIDILTLDGAKRITLNESGSIVISSSSLELRSVEFTSSITSFVGNTNPELAISGTTPSLYVRSNFLVNSYTRVYNNGIEAGAGVSGNSGISFWTYANDSVNTVAVDIIAGSSQASLGKLLNLRSSYGMNSVFWVVPNGDVYTRGSVFVTGTINTKSSINVPSGSVSSKSFIKAHVSGADDFVRRMMYSQHKSIVSSTMNRLTPLSASEYLTCSVVNAMGPGIVREDGRVLSFNEGTAGTISVYDPYSNSSRDVYYPDKLNNYLIPSTLMADGRVFISDPTNNCVVYNPVDDSLTTISGTYSSSGSYMGSVLLKDGTVFICPAWSPDVRIWDPLANTISYVTGNYDLTLGIAGTSYMGCTLLSDGRVFATPCDATSSFIYNHSDRTITTSSAVFPGNGAFSNAVLLHDGKVFLSPGIGNVSTASIYDPVNDTVTTASYNFGKSAIGVDSYMPMGSCLLPDGRVFFVAYGNGARTYFVVYDHINDSGITVDVQWGTDPNFFTFSGYGNRPTVMMDGRVILGMNTVCSFPFSSEDLNFPKSLLLGPTVNHQ